MLKNVYKFVRTFCCLKRNQLHFLFGITLGPKTPGQLEYQIKLKARPCMYYISTGGGLQLSVNSYQITICYDLLGRNINF